MKKQILLLCFIIAYGSLAIAQRNNSYTNTETDQTPFSIGVHVGSQGFGLNAAYETSEVFAIRIASSFAPYGLNKTRNWGNQEYTVDMDAKFYNAQAVAEYKPFKRTSSSRFVQKLAVVGGFAYFFKSEADATAAPKNDYHYGDVVIPKEDLGTVKSHIKWNGFAPYLGAGIRSFELGGNFGLNVDLGTYYLSSPDVTITADKMLSENTSNQETVQENMKNYRWLPVLQVGLSYRF